MLYWDISGTSENQGVSVAHGLYRKWQLSGCILFGPKLKIQVAHGYGKRNYSCFEDEFFTQCKNDFQFLLVFGVCFTVVHWMPRLAACPCWKGDLLLVAFASGHVGMCPVALALVFLGLFGRKLIFSWLFLCQVGEQSQLAGEVSEC